MSSYCLIFGKYFFLCFFHSRFIIFRCFPFLKGNGTCGTLREAIPQSVTEMFSHQFCFSINDINGTFVAGICTGAAAIAFFFIDSNNLSYHFTSVNRFNFCFCQHYSMINTTCMFDFQQGGMILKKYLPILKNSPFFTGLTDNEILSILHCVKATAVSQKRDSYIFRAGDSTEVMGLVVSGCVLVIQEDLWGHRNILSKCHTGDFFGEPYAASPGAVLNVSVVADTDCEIILLNVQRLLISCPTACEHHQKLIRNLVSVLANKILILNDKITHVGKRTTRDKLLSYLSAESIRHSSLSFDIPFDRQQLADYLCIDRAAMSTEISKLQKEGYIKTNRNHFELTVCNNSDSEIKM